MYNRWAKLWVMLVGFSLWSSILAVGYPQLSWATAKPINNIIIESDWIEVFPERELAVFHDNIVVQYNDLLIYSQTMQVKYSNADVENPAQAIVKDHSTAQPAVNSTNNDKIFDRQIERIEFIKQVHLINPAKQENIYSDYAVYDNLKQHIIATGNLKIVNQSGTLWGEQYIYDLTTKTSKITRQSKQEGPKTDQRLKIVIDRNSKTKKAKSSPVQ